MQDKREKNIETIEAEILAEAGLIKKEEKKSSLFSILRLVVFLGIVYFSYISFGKKGSLITIAAAAVMLVMFFLLIYLHARVNRKIKNKRIKQGVLFRYRDRYSDEWKKFPENGSDFLYDKDTVSRDIDLLGNASLYQYLSVAHTLDGKRKLAQLLTLEDVDISKQKDRSEAVAELAELHDFAVRFETISESIDYIKKFNMEVRSVVDAKKLAFGAKLNMVLIPLLNITAIISLFFGMPIWIFWVTFFYGLIVSEALKKHLETVVAIAYANGVKADGIEEMLNSIGEQEFHSKYLAEMREEVLREGGILSSVRGLKRIGAAYNISYNPLVHTILSGVLGWDLAVAFAADKWNQKYSNVFPKCKEVIAEMEVLLSLSVLSYLRDTCQPEVDFTGKTIKGIETKGMMHPLLSMDSVVDNDAELKNELTIITGSNMSGKTTFLRTIAINLVLSYIGAGALAESFRTPYFKIFTSMRVMDDASSGISTFYAEILRIKQMSEYIKEKPEIPAICFIDEIFKGTNSADRIVGAKEALRKLTSEKGNMVLVSTHDFELCELTKKDGEAADNYHFEEFYEDDELKFDYKMRNGRCTTRNAMALLKLAGLSEGKNEQNN